MFEIVPRADKKILAITIGICKTSHVFTAARLTAAVQANRAQWKCYTSFTDFNFFGRKIYHKPKKKLKMVETNILDFCWVHRQILRPKFRPETFHSPNINLTATRMNTYSCFPLTVYFNANVIKFCLSKVHKNIWDVLCLVFGWSNFFADCYKTFPIPFVLANWVLCQVFQVF